MKWARMHVNVENFACHLCIGCVWRVQTGMQPIEEVLVAEATRRLMELVRMALASGTGLASNFTRGGG